MVRSSVSTMVVVPFRVVLMHLTSPASSNGCHGAGSGISPVPVMVRVPSSVSVHVRFSPFSDAPQVPDSAA